MASHDSDTPSRNYVNYNSAQICITDQHHSISLDSSIWNFPRTVSRLRSINLGRNRLTTTNSQNRIAHLLIELENTLKDSSSKDHQLHKKRPNQIHESSNINFTNTKKDQNQYHKKIRHKPHT